METASLQKKNQSKSDASDSTPENSSAVSREHEKSAEPGLPLFLQRAPSASAAPPPPGHNIDLEDENGPLFLQRLMSDSVSPPKRVQAKLKIGQPNDRYEQEADRIATQVMRMPSEAVQPLSACQNAASCGQSGSSCGLDEERIQTKPIGSQITPLFQQGALGKTDAENVLQAKGDSKSKESIGRLPSSGGGQPLASSTRSFFEPRFGADFSKVRTHTDRNATESARALNARAFTIGSDIYFGKGRHPESHQERATLAHELTHTIQQGGSSVDTAANADVESPSQVGSEKIQREDDSSWWDDVTSSAESLYETGAEAVDWGLERGQEAVDWGLERGQEAVDWGVERGQEAVDWGVETAGEAFDWIMTTAGRAALDAANELAAIWGGSVIIRKGCIIITIPEISLFDSFNETLGPTPPIGIFIPIVAGAMDVGPLLLGGMIGVHLYGRLSLEAAVGPGVVRNIYLKICPFSPSVTASAQLYAAIAAGPRLSIHAGISGIGAAFLPTDPPHILTAMIEGSIRGTGTGWLIGAIQDTVLVRYSGGRLTFANLTELMTGFLLQGDLDFFAGLHICDKLICQYVHPIAHWETGRAWKLTIPLHTALGGGTSGTASVGPITWGEMPIGDIETAIKPLPSGWSCPGWKGITRLLCDCGLLPPDRCRDEDDDDDDEGDDNNGDGDGDGAETAGTKYACAICRCTGDRKDGCEGIHTIWMGRRKKCQGCMADAQRLCWESAEYLRMCPVDKCKDQHHFECRCSDRETEEKCRNRAQVAQQHPHDPSPLVPMLPDSVARAAQEHIRRENYAAALEIVVSGLRLNLNLCSFRYVNRTDAGEGLTTTTYQLDPTTGNYVPDGPSRVEIYSPAFATLQWLVSTIMHEYQHVLQGQQEMTEEELDDPTGEHTEADEVEAYLWEIENALGTGLAADLPRMQDTSRRLTSHYTRLGQINPTRQAQYTQRYDAAMRFIADLETGPPPFPSYPHVYHHGSDYEGTQQVYYGEIEARGDVDFGLGFYTHTRENWQLAKEWALRKAVGTRSRGWGVVTLPIPTDVWNGNISSVLIYRSVDDLPPNAPVNPETGRQMNWREFVRYNYRKRNEGNLPSWPEYNVIRGPLWGQLSDTDIRQLVFTSSGAPLLNIPEVRALRILVLKLFRSPQTP